MTECVHENFSAHVGVHRLSKVDGGPITGYVAEITVKCVDCGRPFQFLALQPGYDTQGATVSIDGLTANLALAPEGAALSPLDRIAYSIGAHRDRAQ
jgi:hypothetical protein